MPLISFIPEKYEDGFEKLSLMEDKDFESLTEGLSLISLASSISVLADKISDNKGLDYDDLREIFTSVGSLAPFLDGDQMSKELVKEVSRLAIEGGILESDNKDKFEGRLLFLLTNKHIYYAAKARSLLTEYGSLFISSRVTTDIRPVFDIDISEAPKGGMIVHNLHIHYQCDGEAPHKDIYIALDSLDLKMLKDALLRAEKKEISLQEIFTKSGMTNLNEQ